MVCKQSNLETTKWLLNFKVVFFCSLDYVEEIFNMFIDAKQNKKLEAARLELQAMTPAPIHDVGKTAKGQGNGIVEKEEIHGCTRST